MGRGTGQLEVDRADLLVSGMRAAARERERRRIDPAEELVFEGPWDALEGVPPARLRRYYSQEFLGALAHQYIETARHSRRPVTMEGFEDIAELAFNSLANKTGVAAEKTPPTHPGTDIVLRSTTKRKQVVGRISLKSSATEAGEGKATRFTIPNFVRWPGRIDQPSDLLPVFDKIEHHLDYDDLLVLRTTRALDTGIGFGLVRRFPVIFPDIAGDRAGELAWHVHLMALPTQFLQGLGDKLKREELEVDLSPTGSGRATVSFNGGLQPFKLVVDPKRQQVSLRDIDMWSCNNLGSFYVPADGMERDHKPPVRAAKRPRFDI